jgi:hypothetical protein
VEAAVAPAIVIVITTGANLRRARAIAITMRHLRSDAATLDSIIDSIQPRIVELARQRGLNWAALSDEERERLVDDILHE